MGYPVHNYTSHAHKSLARVEEEGTMKLERKVKVTPHKREILTPLALTTSRENDDVLIKRVEEESGGEGIRAS